MCYNNHKKKGKVMAKKKIRRSEAAHRRKMFTIWIAALFLLVLLVVLDIVVIYNQTHPFNAALAAERDYSKIHFEGLSIGDELSDDKKLNQVIDANYDYVWKNISISVDGDDKIDRLGFYATPEKTIADVSIDYRDYPLYTASDFALYFGQTTIKNFNNYKYLTYADDKYAVDLTLLDGDVYSVSLYKK